MAVWSDWYPDLLPHLPGCPEPIVDHELRRASQVFFEGSRAWKKTLEAIRVRSGEDTVEIDSGDASINIIRIEQAWYDGKPIDVFTPEEMSESFANDWHDHAGTPMAIVQFEPGVVRLYPLPNSNASIGLVVEASVKPSNASKGIPENLRVKFFDSITSGAKARLMIYPNKSWTNFELGMAMGSVFESDINKARLNASLSYGRGRIKSRPRWC